jgi:hypothetical protein
MRSKSKRVSLYLTFALFAAAAVGQTAPPPDCVVASNVGVPSGIGNVPISPPAPTAYYDNRPQQCTLWLVAYTAASGLSGYTVAFQSATGALTPGTFGAFTGNTLHASTSFGTAAAGLALYSNVGTITVDTPFIRVHASGTSGTGSIFVTIQGWKTNWTNAGSGGGSGGTGCPNPCPVTQSTTPWVDDITQWANGVLGAMANYGTSPGAVLVPGVNAFITNPVTVNPTVPSTFNNGQQAVTNTATNLGTNTTTQVCVNSLITSTVEVYVGSSSVTTSGSTGGYQLSPGQGACWNRSNTNLIYVIATGAGATVSFTY